MNAVRRSIRRRAAEQLEQGRASGALARGLSAVWARRARVVRSIHWPDGVATVGVGGATLGGNGVTPTAIDLARELAELKLRVALIVRDYGARRQSSSAVRVAADASHVDVGDEAVMAATALAGTRGASVYAGRRDAAVRMASGSDLLIFDGVLQAAPRPFDLAVLCVHASTPWGAGRCPPAGDLRAPVDELVEAADVVVARGPTPCTIPGALVIEERLESARCLQTAQSLPLSAFTGMRVGVVLTVARPSRVLADLEKSGIRITRKVLLGDHQSLGSVLADSSDVDAWLMTPKCAAKVPPGHVSERVWVTRTSVMGLQPLAARVLQTCNLRGYDDSRIVTSDADK